MLIATDLRSQIDEGALQPGDQLPGHRELAARYSVSLGAAREAISMLIGDGLIETRAGRGTYVAESSRLPRGEAAPPVSRRELEELLEAHELLALDVVEMAAGRASATQIRRLREVLEWMEAATTDAETYSEADLAFQLAIGEAAGNRYLLRAMHDIRLAMRRDLEVSAGVGIQRFGSLRYSVEANRSLVDAIEAGDAVEARRILLEVMNRHHEFAIGLYALAPEPPDEAA